MTEDARPNSHPIPLSECPICSKLRDVEWSFSKWGHEELDQSMPPEAHQLVPVGPTDTPEARRRHLERCPVCGTTYSFTYSSEYLVDGSEDTWELRRLSPDEARQCLDGDPE